jgi:hypothetical protein
LVIRALQGPSDLDKPCRFLRGEAVLQFGERILAGKKVVSDKPILKPADLSDSQFISCEEKIRYKLLAYSSYLMADLKHNMESLYREMNA